MDDVKKQMMALKQKENPDYREVRKYVRYATNILEYDNEKIFDELAHWKQEDIKNAIKEVERENTKPKPKRYFVSLKEPLEDGGL